MTRLAGVWVLLLCGGFGACVSAGSETIASADSVTVALNDTIFTPSDTVAVRVVNGSRRPVLFAFMCDAALEGNAGTEWILFEPDCSAVRVRPTHLAAGEARAGPLSLDALLPDKPLPYRSFRIRLRFQHDDSAGYRFARSEVFTVRPR